MEQQNQQPNQQLNQISIDEQKRKTSKRITIALLVLAAALFVVGGILLLRKSSPPPVSQGKALVYGKAVALSDVQTIPDAPLTEGTVVAIPAERLDSFITEARQANTAFLKKSIISSYAISSSSFDKQGEFQFELDSGSYILCYFFPEPSSEDMRIEACGKTNLETGERLSIQIGKMFGTTITGEGVDPIPLTDIYPIPSDSFDTSTWKTYRNEEFGFEVNYPTDWFFQKGELGMFLLSSNDQTMRISINYFDPSIVSARGITFCEDVLITNSITSRCERLVTKDQVSAVIDWEVQENTAATTLRNFSIILTVESPKKIDKTSKELFRTILSTFRFVE